MRQCRAVVAGHPPSEYDHRFRAPARRAALSCRPPSPPCRIRAWLIRDRAGQRVDDVEVWRREQLGFPLFQPLPRRRALALRAMPVATAVVRDDRVGAALAARDMPPERNCAAALDRTHDLHLVEADVAGIGAPPRRPVVAEDIRDLESWTGHGRPLKPAAAPCLSSWASCAARTASRVGSRWQRSCRWPRACSALSCRACRDRGEPE